MSQRDYTSLSKDSFLTDLWNSIENSQIYEIFETKTVEVWSKYAQRKTKLLIGNHKLHLSQKLRNEKTKRSQLKNIANKTGKDIDLYNFRKQRNLVVNLNKKEKTNLNDSKPFWEMWKPQFSNKGKKTSGNIMLSEKEDLTFKKLKLRVSLIFIFNP